MEIEKGVSLGEVDLNFDTPPPELTVGDQTFVVVWSWTDAGIYVFDTDAGSRAVLITAGDNGKFSAFGPFILTSDERTTLDDEFGCLDLFYEMVKIIKATA